jgi:hypothetical protein
MRRKPELHVTLGIHSVIRCLRRYRASAREQKREHKQKHLPQAFHLLQRRRQISKEGTRD